MKTNKNGFVQTVNELDMRLFGILLVLTFLCSCKQTTTSKEFLNTYTVNPELYKKEKEILEVIARDYIDSIGNNITPPSPLKTIYFKIDTIFYNGQEKFALLYYRKVKHSIYIFNQDSTSYDGGCLIGTKVGENTDSLKILAELTISSSSENSSEWVINDNRSTYLRELKYVKGKYNINDIRFWESDVWEKAEIMNAKMKRYLEMKKTNPEDVYPR